MLILQDYEAEEVIKRLKMVEQEHKEFRNRDKYDRTLAEHLELQFSHTKGKEF